MENDTQSSQFDRLLDLVTPTLNELHAISGSRRFWAILLYRYLRNCLIVHKAQPGLSPAPDIIGDDGDVYGPRAGEMLKSIGCDLRAFAPKPLGPVRRWLEGFAVGRHHTQNAADFCTAVFPDGRSIVGEFHSYEALHRFLSPPAAWLPLRLSANGTIADVHKRKRLRALATEQDWPLGRLALNWLPRFYVEEFIGRYRTVKLQKPEHKEFHVSYLASVAGRFIIARYVEQGSKLNIYQHAAMYGELEDHVLHHAECTIADAFFTWGWQLRDNDIPFFGLRLLPFITQSKATPTTARHWLYVNVRQPFAWNQPVTLEVQERFFEALPTRCRQCVVIRPRVNKGGLAINQVSPKVLGHIDRIDSGKTSMVELESQAEVVILDMFPSTTFMECLVARRPVIAIVPSGTTFTPLASGFYDHFFVVGLLHRTPESAAQFLGETPLRQWWHGIETDGIVAEYMNKFCRTAMDKQIAS